MGWADVFSIDDSEVKSTFPPNQ